MDTGETRLEGRRLTDRYVLEEELASGGMGGLWLARDEVLGRPVAVKVLHDHLARDDDLLERFRLEAVAAARLSHPAVVRVFDTGIDDGVCFIVMELVEGQSVADLLAERRAIPPVEASRIVRGVLQALAHAHREGVIHRDVKPGNILLGRDGTVKLADFGIAKAAFAEGDVTTTGDLLGTSRYLSPEQVTGAEVDERSDLYAAGIVLYELLTGRPPFDAETHLATATMRLASDPPPPGSLRPGIPRALEAVVMRALSRVPDARFQTAEEMSAALERAAPDTGRDRRRPEAVLHEAAPPHRSLIRSWVAVPIALLVAAALVVGGFLLLEGFGTEGPQGGEEPPPIAARLQIAAAYSYDPFGGDGEHDENLPLAIDGDTSTAWSTEEYNDDDLDKDGVGLVIELSQSANVGVIAIETALPGWEFSAYAGGDPASFDLDAPLGGPFTAEEDGTYQIAPVGTRYLLIWIMNLAPADDGHRAVVNEIELFPPGA